MLRFSLALLTFIYVYPSFAQTITEEQEVILPDYILSNTNDAEINDKEDLAGSFEDELANLLKSEKEYLPKFKFRANIFILNKNTNKVTNYTLENGLTVIHNLLEITALNCLHNYNSINNNDYVFLNVKELKSQQELYNSWMSKRYPGLSAFNNQIYSIQVRSCKVSGEIIQEEVEEIDSQDMENQEKTKITDEKLLEDKSNSPTMQENLNNILQPLNLISN